MVQSPPSQVAMSSDHIKKRTLLDKILISSKKSDFNLQKVIERHEKDSRSKTTTHKPLPRKTKFIPIVINEVMHVGKVQCIMVPPVVYKICTHAQCRSYKGLFAEVFKATQSNIDGLQTMRDTCVGCDNEYGLPFNTNDDPSKYETILMNVSGR